MRPSYLFAKTAILLYAQSALAVNSLVKLDYTSYQGVSLRNGITQWLGMRYAQRPIGNLRFAAPRDPLTHSDVQDATKNGKICLSTPGGVDSTHDEDCLFISVYSPSSATNTSKLPVYFFVQGGGFNTNSNANYNGTGLIEASGDNIVVVNFNYRVGPYGFLASKEVSAGGAINNGLLDQRKALKWVQKYITNFGGDPGHVVLGGDSAGAASVTLQLTAPNENLFHATAAESQSFASIRTVSESQYQYDNLVQRASCNGTSDTLACLRSLSETDLQKVNINTPTPGAQDAPLYMYGPVIDGTIVSDYTYAAFRKGNFIKVPAIFGDDTNEGTIFAPKGTNTLDDSNRFLKDQFANLTADQLSNIDKFFPVDGTPTFPNSGRYWRQCANAYGELRYICPGIYLNGIYANNSLPAWNYHWNVIDPTDNSTGYGVKHTVEVNAIWGPQYVTGGPPASYQQGGSNYGIVAVVQGYWTSFIRSYDPNTYRKDGTPEWEKWTKQNAYARLMFQTNNTHMEVVPSDQQTRCGYLSSLADDLRQ
ncbi:hypothetical protein AMS68_003639 [Peltaster fructicola]|uniref:Carboxylic ester hydrolase n=1 Tax=Peltaster fructicola TaxID=286661 RepID=A0A6H0XTM1_9PEZI|nr:hypothetical protein AMS68_003639 [Peltaster fructicola]